MRDLIAEERVYSAALARTLEHFSKEARARLTVVIAEKGALLRDAVLASSDWTQGDFTRKDEAVLVREIFKLTAEDPSLKDSMRDCLGCRIAPGQPFFAVNLGPDYGALELLEEVTKWANAGDVVAVVAAVRLADGSTELRWSRGNEDRTLAMIDLLHAAARKTIWG